MLSWTFMHVWSMKAKDVSFRHGWQPLIKFQVNVKATVACQAYMYNVGHDDLNVIE